MPLLTCQELWHLDQSQGMILKMLGECTFSLSSHMYLHLHFTFSTICIELLRFVTSPSCSLILIFVLLSRFLYHLVVKVDLAIHILISIYIILYCHWSCQITSFRKKSWRQHISVVFDRRITKFVEVIACFVIYYKARYKHFFIGVMIMVYISTKYMIIFFFINILWK